jgi:two-component system cell cycle sensor histidine kinase/response regulator CckA
MSRVLIVEDSPTQAHALGRLLQGAGFEVVQAHNGQQALELLRHSPCDLVLTDVLMPVLDGYQLCRQIKFDPAKRHIPVVFLTALTDPLDILRGIECGVDNYLTKPYEPDVLVRRLRYTLASAAHRGGNHSRIGLKVTFLGQNFTITAGREQLLDVLLSACEDAVRANQQLRAQKEELAAAKAKAEWVAHQSESKYRHLMEQTYDSKVLLDLNGIILEVNRRTEELVGRPATEIVGRSYEEFVPDEERDTTRRLFQQLLAEGRISQINGRILGPGGRRVTVDYFASIIEVDGERLILSVVRDATDRERLEAQLLQAQKMEAVGRLAGGVAHDFNNLLTVINGYSEMLLGQLPAGDSRRNVVSEILAAGQRAASLTRQLLAFSRKHFAQPVILDLNSVVSGVAKMLRRLISEDVELICTLGPNLNRIKADASQIEQVLVNLAVNARDAMPKGGKLYIKTCNIELAKGDPRLPPQSSPGPYVCLIVADTGCGMTEEVKAHLFEPFFTTKEPDRGTGLGLATVYGIIRQAGGFIRVQSEPGQGATFEIYVPRAQEAAVAVNSQPVEEELRGGTETLLLVEDEDSVRTLARLALEARGYTVLTARHGTEALEICQRHAGPIHLAITDVVMPQMGGWELVERLRARWPELRVLYLSGYADHLLGRTNVLTENDSFLHKPFSVTSLAGKVREVLDRPAQTASGVC